MNASKRVSHLPDTFYFQKNASRVSLQLSSLCYTGFMSRSSALPRATSRRLPTLVKPWREVRPSLELHSSFLAIHLPSKLYAMQSLQLPICSARPILAVSCSSCPWSRSQTLSSTRLPTAIVNPPSSSHPRLQIRQVPNAFEAGVFLQLDATVLIQRFTL